MTNTPDGYIIKDVTVDDGPANLCIMRDRNIANEILVTISFDDAVNREAVFTYAQALTLVSCLSDILGGAEPKTQELLDGK